ncbi:unnamed protein product [Rotaria socialis]|uniref:PRKR-interacting protein 1 n=1 Tax=Rotaria socialis TaxID=392032 RepID=A0A818XI00_9BILA|nr:unnamed protein product [Rotaria socialis]CAF4701368.1 unnamed protein product [Rotaria socialis]
MSSDEEERSLKKQVFKSSVEIQKARLERLMKNVEKPVFIPQTRDMKTPRAFTPHEYVRNVMGASAGAGSGEFDIYRGCRRRQMIREAYLNREAKEKEANAEWLKKVETSKQKADSQAAKKRQKRLKRKAYSKNKNHNDNQNANKTNESASSSSEDEGEEKSQPETNTSDAPVANTEENQSAKESIPLLSSSLQPNEKTDIRKHVRHRKADSSDDEKEEKKLKTTN